MEKRVREKPRVYPSGLTIEALMMLLPSEPPYRAKQVFNWFSKGIHTFEAMTNVPQELRDALSEHFGGTFFSSAIEKQLIDDDGSLKLQIRLRDGAAVECVLLEDIEGRKTACLSSQVGCPMRCAFCKTGSRGFLRNLGQDEILEQFHFLRNLSGHISNVVFMGMGEPLLNLENVHTAISLLSSPEGIGMSSRKITISTSGIVPGIRALITMRPIVRLAVSLTSANPALRSKLMPVNITWPLEELKNALLEYQNATKDRITLEVVLIGNVNDQARDAIELAHWIEPLKAHVNLIAWNPIEGMEFQTPSTTQIDQYAEILEQEGITAVRRMSRGRGVMGACGQLGDTLQLQN